MSMSTQMATFLTDTSPALEMDLVTTNPNTYYLKHKLTEWVSG
jgi:hypothetical protein